MQLYLTLDDPIHTTLVNADGQRMYCIHTEGTFSTFRTTTTFIYRAEGNQRGTCAHRNEEALGDVVWGGIGRWDTVRSALFGAQEGKVRVKDLLFTDNAFGRYAIILRCLAWDVDPCMGRSRLFIAADEQMYKWKWCESRGLQVLMPSLVLRSAKLTCV
jgi:hypothetical protein